jgi:hypothetical protein
VPWVEPQVVCRPGVSGGPMEVEQAMRWYDRHHSPQPGIWERSEHLYCIIAARVPLKQKAAGPIQRLNVASLGCKYASDRRLPLSTGSGAGLPIADMAGRPRTRHFWSGGIKDWCH